MEEKGGYSPLGCSLAQALQTLGVGLLGDGGGPYQRKATTPTGLWGKESRRVRGPPGSHQK